MGYNIGPKIGIEGEAEFRKQIRAINAEYKTLTAQTRAVTAEFEANDDVQGKLKSQSEQLVKQIEVQRKKMELLEDAAAKAASEYGENSIEANRLKGVLYDTQATMAKLESELRDANQQLEDLENNAENAGDAAEDAEDDFLGFGDVLKANFVADAALDFLRELGEGLVEIGGQAIEAAADVKAQSAQFEQTFGAMQSAAASALESISDETSISVTRMKDSYTALYAYSKTVGAESTEALSYATRAMNLAADSAAYYDKSIEDVTESLQSFLKGNYENDAALGISCTETTRNAKANELYATSFDKLAESQKVDVLLAMVEAGNAASGALGQAAREADSWANVTGELQEAWTQLLAVIGSPVLEGAIPILQKLTSWINSLTEKTAWEELSDGVDEFVTSMESAETEYKNTVSANNAAVYAAERYVQRLGSLEAAGLDTAEAQAEYAHIVEELNGLIPSLNLTIDEQTGLITTNTKSVLANISAWKETAVQEAIYAKMTAQVEAYGDAQAQLIEAKVDLADLEDEELSIKEKLITKTGMTAAQVDVLAESLKANSAQYATGKNSAEDLANMMVQLGMCTADTDYETMLLQAQLIKNYDAQDNLNDAIAEGEEIVSGYEVEINSTTAALDRMEESNGDMATSQDTAKQKLEETRAALESLQAEYDAARESARESIDQQIGYFDKLSAESDWTAKKIVDNWLAQQEAFNNYADNLQKAVDMNLPQELVDQLSDGSEESMLILDALVNDTDVSVEEIVAAFGGMDAARDKVSSVVADIDGEFTSGLSDLKGKLKTLAIQAGTDTIAGLAKGVNDNVYQMEKAMNYAASSGIKAYKDVMQIQSPSHVMYDAGDDTVSGAVNAVEDRTRDFELAMENMAEAGYTSFAQNRLSRAEAYPSMVNASGTSSNATTNVNANYGGFTVQVYQQPGEDSEALAYRLMDIMQSEITKREVSFNV